MDIINYLLPRLRVICLKMLVDATGITVSLLLAFFFLKLVAAPGFNGLMHLVPWATVQVGLVGILVGYAAVGLYPGYGLSNVDRLRRGTLVTFSVFTIITVWEFGTGSRHAHWAILILTFCFAIVLLPILNALGRALMLKMGLWGEPVVIIGHSDQAGKVRQLLEADRDLGFIPIETVVAPCDPETSSESEIAAYEKLIREVAQEVRIAIVTEPDHVGDRLSSYRVDHLPFQRVIIIPNIDDMGRLWMTARDLGGTLALEISNNLLYRRYKLIKKAGDFFVGWILFLLVAPIIGLLAWFVSRADKGSPFYAQVREGLNGREIKVWKLRTMYTDSQERLDRLLAEDPQAKAEWEQYFKLKNDPRIIPGIGHFLRKFSLDELPQLYNVVCGELSLVGPRPFPHYHLECFGSDFRKLRRSVLPGITGLWQVSARSDGDIEVQEALDSYYIHNWSIWLDVDIMIRTFKAVFFSKGAY
ncbi:MAG: exopolysaccharide biosynthesis polyprenyl glycosylphosphotransferase [Pseudomonadales bacterium]|nr:exopolysaccharide biosynthesis polyprenyl glycosylphosphotransferase [Pseudomonadales bacterium]